MTIEGQKAEEVHAVQRVKQAQGAKQTPASKCKFCGKQHEWKNRVAQLMESSAENVAS